jgi:hypothetical protein
MEAELPRAEPGKCTQLYQITTIDRSTLSAVRKAMDPQSSFLIQLSLFWQRPGSGAKRTSPKSEPRAPHTGDSPPRPELRGHNPASPTRQSGAGLRKFCDPDDKGLQNPPGQKGCKAHQVPRLVRGGHSPGGAQQNGGLSLGPQERVADATRVKEGCNQPGRGGGAAGVMVEAGRGRSR